MSGCRWSLSPTADSLAAVPRAGPSRAARQHRPPVTRAARAPSDALLPDEGERPPAEIRARSSTLPPLGDHRRLLLGGGDLHWGRRNTVSVRVRVRVVSQTGKPTLLLRLRGQGRSRGPGILHYRPPNGHGGDADVVAGPGVLNGVSLQNDPSPRGGILDQLRRPLKLLLLHLTFNCQILCVKNVRYQIQTTQLDSVRESEAIARLR